MWRNRRCTVLLHFFNPCFLFWRSRVQMSVQKLVILNDIFLYSLAVQENVRILLEATAVSIHLLSQLLFTWKVQQSVLDTHTFCYHPSPLVSNLMYNIRNTLLFLNRIRALATRCVLNKYSSRDASVCTCSTWVVYILWNCSRMSVVHKKNVIMARILSAP